MKILKNYVVMASIGAVAVALAGQSPALAQAQPQAASEDSSGIADIVVTARKREESLISVPVAVTALSSVELNRYSANDLTSISRLAPTLVVTQSVASAGAAYFIRGIGSTPQDSGVDTSVNILLDGVSLSRGRFITTSVFDLAQVEVLKGPQALFFGKNASAGVVSLRSADPTDTLSGFVKGGYEFRADERYVEAAIGGPLSDSLKARVAVRASEQAGYMRNLALAGPNPFEPDPTNPQYPLPGRADKRQPAKRDLGGRLTLVYDAGSNFDATLKVTGGRDRGNADSGPSETICRPGVQDTLNGVADPYDNCKLDLKRSVGAINPKIAAGFPGARDGRPYTSTDTVVAVGTMNYHFNDLTLTSVSGYTYLNYKGFENYDWTVYAQIASAQAERNRVLSQELRLSSDWAGPINFALGAYAEKTKKFRGGNTIFVNVGPDAEGFFDDYQQINHAKGTSLSAFAQLRWSILDNLELSGGARYSHDKKTDSSGNIHVNPIIGPAINLLPAGVFLSGKFTDNNVSPEATLSWHPDSNSTLYASYKTGYKAGGFANPGILTNAYTIDTITVQSEKGKGGEIGYKARLFDRKLQVDIVGFYYTYSNLQLASYDSQTVSYQIRNAGKARTKGVEASAEWRVVQPLTLRGSIAYDDAYYVENGQAQCYAGQPAAECVNAVQNLAGHPLVLAPKWVVNLGATFDTPISDSLGLGLDFDARHTTGYFTEETEDPTLFQPGYWLLNVSARLHTSDDKWELAVIGKNLTNKLYFTNGGQKTGGDIGAYFVVVQPPRTVAVQATYRF